MQDRSASELAAQLLSDGERLWEQASDGGSALAPEFRAQYMAAGATLRAAGAIVGAIAELNTRLETIEGDTGRISKRSRVE